MIIQNTHGVVFTPTSRIDVGGLVATSRQVAADRFAADGRIEIRGGEAPGARVENQGGITVREAGLAALVGGRVANSGTIVAPRGTVALASGETTTIDLAGDGMVRIAVSGDAGRSDAGVENTGLIDAGGGLAFEAAADLGLVDGDGALKHAVLGDLEDARVKGRFDALLDDQRVAVGDFDALHLDVGADNQLGFLALIGFLLRRGGGRGCRARGRCRCRRRGRLILAEWLVAPVSEEPVFL